MGSQIHCLYLKYIVAGYYLSVERTQSPTVLGVKLSFANIPLNDTPKPSGIWVGGVVIRFGAFVCPINDERQCIGVYLDCPESERCKEMKKVLDQSLEDGPSGEF